MKATTASRRDIMSSATRLLLMIAVFAGVVALPSHAWVLVSSPDWFNRDVADLSGATVGIAKAEGWDDNVSEGLNGISPQMATVYDLIVGEMSTYRPELILVAGDLIRGRWFNELTLDMFDPDTRSRTAAIDNAAAIYYPWYRLLFARHGIDTVIGALGDHELGDNSWLARSEKALHVDDMKQAFGRNMVDPLGLSATINGADARPYGTPFEHGSYAYQHNNLLVIAVDVFKQDDPNTNIHTLYGTVSPEVSGVHLAWLGALLDAADEDPSIDHVIVQGHTPVLRPVRMHSTSGMMMVDREDSGFWQLLRQHDHRHGGKVRLYLCGEVHAVTASKDPESDIVQLVHGDPPWGAGVTNVMVFNIQPERIDIESREFVLFEDGSSLYWQVDEPVSSGPSSVMPSTGVGTLVIDTSAAATSYLGSGNMELVDQLGLTFHFGFDETTASGAFSNTGSIGNQYYEGIAYGGLSTEAGLFGAAVRLNGTDAYMESGRGNITEGESRTASAWIKTSSGSTTQTVLSYGRDWLADTSINGRFNMQIASGRLRLNIGPGRSCVPDGAPGIADGNWHHVAVVLPGRHVNRCEDVLYYVDGHAFAASPVNASAVFDTVSWQNFRVGVGISTVLMNFFNGAIDDAAVWGSPLSGAKVRALATAGRDSRLHYDAFDMELLFDLFDAQQGEAVIDGLSWSYTSGLDGSGGDVLESGERIAIQLDALGNGVAADRLPAVEFKLLCSADSAVDGTDPDCSGGNFGDELWIYLWPEGDVASVDFYLDGVFNRTESVAPFELDGGSPTSLSVGSHTVRAVVQLAAGGSEEVIASFDIGGNIDLSGTVKTVDGSDICALVLASGQFTFSCKPVGVFSLADLSTEHNGTVKRQIYADGFLPKIDILTGSGSEAVVMTPTGTCPNYNTPYHPAVLPESAGKRINIGGQILLQNSQTPICAMVLANGQHMFSCDGSGSYALNIPLDNNGQFKLQVYADGFAPAVQTFDEFSTTNTVRMARAVECQ